MKTLGLDLGGTKIAAAVVEGGRILSKLEVATPQSGFEAVLDVMAGAAITLLDQHNDVATVGVGSPGPLDLAGGMILFAPNIAGLERAPLVQRLSERLKLPIVLENDANAAGYAEHLFGAARELSSSIYVTISTGIGGGIFVGDTVMHGAHGSAGEVGHMILAAEGPLCGCGHQGCWEALASGRAIAREAAFSYGTPLTTKDVFERAKRGELRAARVIDSAARHTGMGLANLLKAFDPDGFVIGGGMIRVGPFYLDRIRAHFERYCEGFPQVKLFVAELGTDAGVIGAASVAARGLESAQQ